MKLQVTQENLNKALANVARIANSRTTLPILSNVLLKTVNNRLSIAATNLDIAITHYVGAKVSDEGSITVPARLMQDFVGSLPSGTIELELEDHKLHVTAGQYKSTINGVSAEDFPVMPAITEGAQWSLPAPALKKGLQQVVLAASGDESRPLLTGIYFHTEKNELFLAATDSYRLAEKRLIKLSQATGLLVPASAMQDLLRVLGDSDEAVNIVNDDQQVLFKVNDVELVTRLIEGSYPDYKRLIPASFTTKAVIKKSELSNITKVSSLFARENAGSVTFKVDEATQTVSIHSIASQLGENNAEAPAQVQGSGEITLNSRYLLDALGVISADEVEFCFNGKLEACVLRGSGQDDYTHIVMPLKS
jgi:DNA polymerase-3 subunit beta